MPRGTRRLHNAHMAWPFKATVSEEAPTAWEHRIRRLPWYTVPGILFGVPALFAILIQINSRIFYDHIVWKYYWGPIAADAAGRATLSLNGVETHAGYNMVNTLTWALLMGVCIVGIAQILVRFNQPMDARMVIGATAWVVAGSVWHVVEDTDLIEPPLQYVFITPPIYLLFGLFGILSYLLGEFAARVEKKTDASHGMRQIWLVQMFIVLGYTWLWRNDWDGMIHYANPLWIAACAVITQAILWWDVRRRGQIEGASVLLILSVGWLLSSLVFVREFLNDPWKAQGANALPEAVWLAPLLAGILTGLVYAGGRAAVNSGKGWGRAFMHPVNLLIVFAQVLDGVATSLGLDMAGYVEKHVLSAALIDTFKEFSIQIGFDFGATYPTFLSFVPVKLLLSLFVIYVIDINGKEDAQASPTLIGMVKFAIIMVGIGPGIRDFVRLAMGV